MKNLLHLSTSLFADLGIASALSLTLTNRLNLPARGWGCVHLDFSRNPVHHLTGEYLAALATPVDRRSDHLRSYLRTVLGFLGRNDVELIVADGLNLGAESKQQSLRDAHRQIDVLVAKLTAPSAERSAA